MLHPHIYFFAFIAKGISELIVNGRYVLKEGIEQYCWQVHFDPAAAQLPIDTFPKAKRKGNPIESYLEEMINNGRIYDTSNEDQKRIYVITDSSVFDFEIIDRDTKFHEAKKTILPIYIPVREHSLVLYYRGPMKKEQAEFIRDLFEEQLTFSNNYWKLPPPQEISFVSRQEFFSP